MMNLRKFRCRLLAAAGLATLAIGVGIDAGVHTAVIRERRLEAAYVEVQIGDSRERLLEIAGPADAVGKCSDADRHYGYASCHQDLRYSLRYQSWYYAFDREGKLEQKVECFLGEYCNKVGR
jgi:hypothetical protein